MPEFPPVEQFHGFESIRGADGYRLRLVMPGHIARFARAEIVCRGRIADGALGNPAVMASRLGEEMSGRRVVAPIQMHGAAIVPGRPIWALPARPKADGVHLDFGADPGGEVLATLRFADCVPVTVASAFPRPWILVLHSGFMGTLAGIFAAAWRKLVSFYGALDGRRTYVWLGPAIGPCCYTRPANDASSERAAAEWGDAARDEGGFIRFDLHRAITAQALAAGLPPENIHRFGLCASCRKDLFYSYRAGEPDDRMMLLAGFRQNLTEKSAAEANCATNAPPTVRILTAAGNSGIAYTARRA